MWVRWRVQASRSASRAAGQGVLDAVRGAAGEASPAGAGGAVAMTVQRDEREARAPRTRFMITDILDAAPRDLSAHRDSDSDRSATDSPGQLHSLKPGFRTSDPSGNTLSKLTITTSTAPQSAATRMS